VDSAAQQAHNHDVEVLLLGPFELRVGGDPISLRRQKHRALIALLALHPREAVSSDRLVEELWGSEEPKTARQALQNYVSLLRKQLTSGAIATQSGGYALNVDPDQVDAGGRLPDGLIDALRAGGFLRLQLPPDESGLGLSGYNAFRVLEAAASWSVPVCLVLAIETAVGLGAFLVPWSLVAIGAATVVQAKLSTLGDWLALVVFFLIAMSSFLVMELYAAFSPEAAHARLERVRAWIDAHTDQAIIVGALALGGYLVADSIFLLVS